MTALLPIVPMITVGPESSAAEVLILGFAPATRSMSDARHSAAICATLKSFVATKMSAARPEVASWKSPGVAVSTRAMGISPGTDETGPGCAIAEIRQQR